MFFSIASFNVHIMNVDCAKFQKKWNNFKGITLINAIISNASLYRWGISSNGRALASRAGGTEIDTRNLQIIILCITHAL